MVLQKDHEDIIGGTCEQLGSFKEKWSLKLGADEEKGIGEFDTCEGKNRQSEKMSTLHNEFFFLNE